MPRTLSRDDAKVTAVRCKEILAEYEIIDVEIAFRESVFMFTRSAGPPVLDHVPFDDPTADVRSPFTPTLGLQIAPKAFPYFEGTGCLYLRAARTIGSSPLRPAMLFSHSANILTISTIVRITERLGARLFTSAARHTRTLSRPSWPRLGTMIDLYKDEIDGLEEAVAGEEAKITTTRKAFEVKLAEAEASRRAWTSSTDISPGPGAQSLNRGKFIWDAFRGNVIHLGTKLTVGQFMVKMYPHAETRAKFKYPRGGFMQLRDFVKDGELRRPTMLDANGDECFIVVKNGTSTGVTLGRATGIESFVRDYNEHGIHSTSMEIAIYPYSHRDGAFSAPGDSGTVIGEANSRILGMIIGGAGQTDSTDVTYASAYYFLDECIKKVFPSSCLYPIPA